MISSQRTRTLLKFLLFLGLNIGLIFIVLYFAGHIKKLAILGYPGIFLISLLSNATIFFPIPGFAVVFALGHILNPYWVGIFAGIGAAMGESTSFFLGVSGKGLVEENRVYRKLRNLIQKNGALIIFFLGAVPNPFFDIGGIIAGATGMNYLKFLGAAILGKTIRFILIALSGKIII